MSPYSHMWWDAPEPIEEPETEPTDDLVIHAGACSWFSLLAHDDDTDD